LRLLIEAFKGEFNMWRMVGLLLVALSVRPILASENWPLTVKVLSTKNIEDPHGSFHLSWFSSNAGWSQSSAHAGWSHRIAEHAFVEADNGNSYELQPKNPKDMLLPGTYQAKIEKRDMMVCEPKDNGKCREVKFFVVGAVPTAKATETIPEAVGATAKTRESTPRMVQSAPGQDAALPIGAPASITFESAPPGADIEVDGAFVGNTPSTVTVAPGSHQIAVKKKGFTDWTKTLNVTGGTVHLNAELEQAPPAPPQ
jgi:hypothetical protein